MIMGVSNDQALAEDDFGGRRRGRNALGGLLGLAALVGALVDCSHDDAASEPEPSPRAIASASTETSLTTLRATFPGALDDGIRAGGALHDSALTAPGAAQVTLPPTADGTATVSDPASGLGVGFRLLGAASVTSQRTGRWTSYPRGGPEGSDVVHRVDDTGLEDFVAFWQRPDRESLRYELDVADAAGLRWVANSLEVMDHDGAPRLRVAPPYVVDRRGDRHPATLAVEGCAVDTSPAPPWGRAPVEPGSPTCTVVV